jgi:hypothetical protein
LNLVTAGYACMSSPFQYNPNRLPDSHFERGSLDHLVVGNEARALDYRRTPLRVREIRESSGLIVFEILDFEDKGNTWEIPFEDVDSLQFALAFQRLDARTRFRYEAIAERLNKHMEIACGEISRRVTLSDISAAEQDARQWLRRRSTALRTAVQPNFLGNEGLTLLYEDMDAYMKHHDLEVNESVFVAHYVCKFHHSECVKAQRIVLAEMGLVPYEGKILRDEQEFQGRFSGEKRRDYVIRRLAVVRALYAELGVHSILVYRGIHSAGLPERPRNRTFVSTTTNLAIAESLACFREPSNENKAEYKVGILMSQQVPVERIFMTYMETRQMNHPYRESEVVLLYDPNEAF